MKATHLTTAQLADRWHIAAGTLHNMRSAKRGPSYIKIGSSVRYRISDIERYEATNAVTN